MSFIHWYPGHIAKAENQLKELTGLVDVCVEVRDSRIPFSSAYPNIEKITNSKPRLILLNKSDLVETSLLNKWIEKIHSEKKVPTIGINLKTDRADIVKQKAIELAKPAMERLKAKGLLSRPVRILVLGMPNVGKSTLINKLIKKNKVKTGAKAGVTRQLQWVRIHPQIDLLDSPGIIPLTQPNQEIAFKLACVSSIGENAYDNEFVSRKLLDLLQQINYRKNLIENYNLSEDDEISLESIAKSRGWLLQKGKLNIEKCAATVLSDFRNTRIGKIILDDINELVV